MRDKPFVKFLYFSDKKIKMIINDLQSLKAVHPCGFSPQTVLRFPVNLSYEACSLLTSLLQFYPSQRLGSGPTGLEDLMNHPFFIGLDWKAIIKNGE